MQFCVNFRREAASWRWHCFTESDAGRRSAFPDRGAWMRRNENRRGRNLATSQFLPPSPIRSSRQLVVNNKAAGLGGQSVSPNSCVPQIAYTPGADFRCAARFLPAQRSRAIGGMMSPARNDCSAAFSTAVWIRPDSPSVRFSRSRRDPFNWSRSDQGVVDDQLNVWSDREVWG